MAGIGKLAKFAQKAAKTLEKNRYKYGKRSGFLKNADGTDFIGRDGKRIEIFKRTTRNGLFGKKQTIISRVYEGEDKAFVRTVQQGKKNKMSYSVYADGRVTQSRVNTKTGKVEARTEKPDIHWDSDQSNWVQGDNYLYKEVTGNNKRRTVQNYDSYGNELTSIELEKTKFRNGDFGIVKTKGDDAEVVIIKADKSATYRNTKHRDEDGNWGNWKYDDAYGTRPYDPPAPAPKAKTSHRGRNITLGAIGLTMGAPLVFSLLNNKDNNNIPTEPIVTNDSIPAAPVDSVPATPVDSVPVANNDSILVVNNDSIPVVNNDSIPIVNNDSIPAEPVNPEPVEENDKEDNDEEQQPPVQQTPPSDNLFNGEINEITKASVEIEKGDCLWNIAKRELQAANPGKTITNAQILKQVKEFGRLNPEMFGENPSLQKLDLIYPDKQLKLRILQNLFMPHKIQQA